MASRRYAACVSEVGKALIDRNGVLGGLESLQVHLAAPKAYVTTPRTLYDKKW